jgi:hypothetical protein
LDVRDDADQSAAALEVLEGMNDCIEIRLSQAAEALIDKHGVELDAP